MPKKLFDPIFLLDSGEKFQPLAVESVEKVGTTIVVDGKKTDVKLNALPPGGGRMDLPNGLEKQDKELRSKYGKVGYRREVSGGGLTWVQYWLWYLYNPKRIALVTGNHEGDWEFVQVGYAGDTPVCMSASQHHSGGARMWWDVEKRSGRPVIYVALGSHANFFSTLDELPEIGDEGDGRGAALDKIKWQDFGTWATWPGLWGNSTGPGTSPQSPGCQGERWNAPHRYHSKAEIQL